MKKLLALILTLALLCPCALAEANANDALLEMAGEAAEKLAALCGVEGYARMYSGSPEIVELIESWGGDWAAEAPRRAAVAFVGRDTLDALFPELLRAAGMSDELLAFDDFLIGSFASAPANVLNGREGVNWVAAGSVARYSETRLLEGAEPGVGWALLDYGEAHPMALVSIFIRGDGTVSLSASFVPAQEFADEIFAVADGSLDLPALVREAVQGDDEEAALAELLLGALAEVRFSTY